MNTNNYKPESISLADIPELEYSGYVWGSDKDKYERVDCSFEEMGKKYAVNPFIVEGYLRSKDEKIAVVIKHVGDKVMVGVWDLKEMARFEKSEVKMVAVKGGHVVFEQYWISEVDANCENMPVLVPMVSLFKGFSNENKTK